MSRRRSVERRQIAARWMMAFECGLIFQKLLDSSWADTELIYTANCALVRSMAKDHKLDVTFEKAGESKSYATFTRAKRLRLIDGGKSG